MMLFFSMAFAGRPMLQVDQLIELVVLDVNATHGAFKVVHTLADVEGLEPARDCQYAGMKDHPTAGVDLVVVELVSGKQERFTVYQAVRQELDPELNPPTPCTPHTTSEKVLAAAKARMKAVGLDPTAKPQPVEGGKIGGTTFEDGSVSMSNDDMMSRTVTWTIARDNTQVYTSERTHTVIMAGQGEARSHGFWAVPRSAPTGAVALEHWWTFDGRGGAANAISFTPLLPLK